MTHTHIPCFLTAIVLFTARPAPSRVRARLLWSTIPSTATFLVLLPFRRPRPAGALPIVPYHLAFWGVPCVNFSGLRRRDTPSDFLSGVVGSLVIFREALSDLRLNPPSIFIVENTASLLGLPWVLECINQALDALPYHWRYPSLVLAFFLPPFPP